MIEGLPIFKIVQLALMVELLHEKYGDRFEEMVVEVTSEMVMLLDGVNPEDAVNVFSTKMHDPAFSMQQAFIKIQGNMSTSADT